jgi:Ca2+-binding EF-hand superfamily protein
VKAGKKILSLALVVLMCLSMLPVGALAEDDASQEIEILETQAEDTEIRIDLATEEEPAGAEETLVLDGASSGICGENLTWKLINGVLTISGQGAMTAYDSTDDIPWNSVKRTIKTVVIKSGVTTIGDKAFYGCTSLTTVTLPEGLTAVGNNAFYRCTSLTSIALPMGVTTIGEYAFASCSSLASITLAEGLTTIDTYAFESCKSLTSITLPEGLTIIGNSAFYRCTGLTEIVLPESVTTIGEYAFGSCRGLTTVTLPEGLTTISTGTFDSCTSLTSIELPKGVTNISTGAFGYCTSLTSITLPEGLTTIGTAAFQFCKGLTTITLPDSLTTIDSNAFYSCSSLTGITIPKSVTAIGNKAFYGCTSLSQVAVLNINCTIADEATTLGVSGTTKIYGYANSTAQTYAETYGYDFEAIEHEHTFDVVTTPATCTADGVKTYTCTLCETTQTETTQKLGHDYQATVVKPTCTAKGYTIHQCSRCDSSYKDNETAMIAHSWDKGKVTKEATYTTVGEKTFTCTVCKTTKTETIAKLSYQKGDVDGDGYITLKDVTLLFQYVNQQITKDKVKAFAAADVDGDKDVTLKDVTKLFQYVNQQINSL